MAVVRHLGVIGAGLAGLATALAAAQAGVRVQLFEAQPEPLLPAAHIEVVPNLLRDLAGLGVAEACVRSGFPYQGLAVLDSECRHHFELGTPHLAGARWPAALGMGYGQLLAVLREAVLAQGVSLHRGQPVLDACEGGAILTQDGQRHPVDLAVVASGEQLPRVAGAVLAPVPVMDWPQRWCHVALRRPLALERATWIVGQGALRALLVPMDTRQAGLAVLQPAGAALDAAGLRQALAGQGAWLRALAALWSDEAPVLSRPVSSGLLDGPWHAQGVLRVGRSAHRWTPFFGQAAAQSVEDAVVLGDLLRQGLDRVALLDAFTARRGERARQVHAVTTQATRWQLQPEAGTDLRALARQLAPLVASPP